MRTHKEHSDHVSSHENPFEVGDTVVCTEGGNYYGPLTQGEAYKVVETTPHHVRVIGDLGTPGYAYWSRFEAVKSAEPTETLVERVGRVTERAFINCPFSGTPWRFAVQKVRGTSDEDGQVYIQARFYALDAETGQKEEQRGRKWLVSEYATDSEIVLTMLAAVKMAVQHEVHEAFKVHLYADGDRDRPLGAGRVVEPHVDVFALAAANTFDLPKDARQHLDDDTPLAE